MAIAAGKIWRYCFLIKYPGRFYRFPHNPLKLPALLIKSKIPDLSTACQKSYMQDGWICLPKYYQC